MAELEIPGLTALCTAIREEDPAAAAIHAKQLMSANGQIVTILDQLAQAELAGGDTVHAVRLLQVLERLVPENPFILVHRLKAQIEAGVAGAPEELVRSAARVTDGALLFYVVEFLVASGFLDEADGLTQGCSDSGTHSRGVLAACRARVLFARGRLWQALTEISELSSAHPAHPIPMRYRELLLEHLLDFAAVDKVGHETALRWGEAFDLSRTVERLIFGFEIERAQALLQTFAAHHTKHSETVQTLAARLKAVQAELDAAVIAHGPLAVADPDAIYAALSLPTSPSHVLWGKASLSAFLNGSGMTEVEFDRFGWFLPNWEDARVRHQVLAAARRVCPAAVDVRQRWLGHLMLLGAYADAAIECHGQLADRLGGDTLFQAVVLLRLQQGGTVPSFMEASLFEALRERLLGQLGAAEPGFTYVVHDHLVALGWTPQPWAAETLLPHDDEMAITHRRLLAVNTGRLTRVGTTPRRAAPRQPRPVMALSGQLRGFETAWASIYELVCRPIGAPIVMSIWDKSLNATGRHARRLERMLPDDIVARLRPEERYTDTFAAAYPATAGLLFGQTAVSASAVRALVDGSGCEVCALETESEDVIEALLPGFISANMLKMYYKFARLEALLREQEVQTGEIFSHVVWVRPDCEVVRLNPRDLLDCLKRPDIAWSSFVSENAFGDYLMILPREAFAAIASIFPRVCLAGDTRLLPWRPSRPNPGSKANALGAFGGPDVLFDILLAAGYMPYNRIPRIVVQLHGRTPGHAMVRETFDRETATRVSTA